MSNLKRYDVGISKGGKFAGMFETKYGPFVKFDDIKEARPTVRVKRPVQQRKAKMPRKCKRCVKYDNCSVSYYEYCQGNLFVRGTSAVA